MPNHLPAQVEGECSVHSTVRGEFSVVSIFTSLPIFRKLQVPSQLRTIFLFVSCVRACVCVLQSKLPQKTPDSLAVCAALSDWRVWVCVRRSVCTALVVWYGSSILSIREGARKTLLRGEESTRRTRRRAAAQTHQRVYDDALARCVHFHHYASPYPTLSTTVPILHPPVPSKATQTRLPWSRHPPWSSKPANKTNQKNYTKTRARHVHARAAVAVVVVGRITHWQYAQGQRV